MLYSPCYTPMLYSYSIILCFTPSLYADNSILNVDFFIFNSHTLVNINEKTLQIPMNKICYIKIIQESRLYYERRS